MKRYEKEQADIKHLKEFIASVSRTSLHLSSPALVAHATAYYIRIP
jgi:hypothetical protein